MAIEYRSLTGADAEVNLVIGTTVVALDVPASLQNRGRAVVQNRDADLLFTLNGVEPVAEDPSTGMRLFYPASLICEGTEMRNLRMVRADNKDSAVYVRFETRLT